MATLGHGKKGSRELDITGTIVGPELNEEVGHFLVCEHCGQAIDCRSLAQVLHHDQPEHKPIRLDA